MKLEKVFKFITLALLVIAVISLVLLYLSIAVVITSKIFVVACFLTIVNALIYSVYYLNREE